MARRTVTIVIDDITGRQLPDDAAETVQFSLDGVGYELDVDSKTAQKIRETLTPFTSAGRKVTRDGRSAARTVKTPASSTAVRAWAAAHGVSVSDRGRIPAEVLRQFEAAGN